MVDEGRWPLPGALSSSHIKIGAIDRVKSASAFNA